VDSETPEARAIASFKTAFSCAPTIAAFAPGRVNIIGEHTDYNDGFVLPAALSAGTVVVGRTRADSLVRVIAADFGGADDAFRLDVDISIVSGASWQNHVRGMVSEMRAAFSGLSGFDLVIAGCIPKGAGLSSSASVAVAVGAAISELNGLDFDRVSIARMAQRSECNFVGTQCGIMDQLASACGVARHGLLIDCRDTSIRPVRIPDEFALLIVQSGVVRQLSEGRYNDRRRECAAAVAALGVSSLRELDVDELSKLPSALSDMVKARVRHVVSENQRVIAAAEALARRDIKALGLLMADSHRSLRDDFAVSHESVDQLVAITQDAIGSEGGARMTGGGFGGAIVAVLHRERLDDVTSHIAATYRDPQGNGPEMMVEEASSGAWAGRILPG
jgi:galactokinase